MNPSLLTRMVYHVGKPWILDGNRFLPETGIPILNNARNNVTLAVCEPDPLTVAMVTEKSLIIFSDIKTPVCFDAKIDKKRPIDNKSNWQEGQGEKLVSGRFRCHNTQQLQPAPITFSGQ
jgi:hypothetical protein